MDTKEWMNEIKIDDLPNEDFKLIAEIIGVQSAVKLMAELGGSAIYIPQIEATLRPFIQRAIIQEYDGDNVRQLSRKYGLTERSIYRILATRSVAEKPPVAEQLSFLGGNP